MPFTLTPSQKNKMTQLSDEIRALIESSSEHMADTKNRGRRVARMKADLISRILLEERAHKYELVPGPLSYIEDLMGTRASIHSIESPRFTDAYNAARSISNWGREIRWRVYVNCWAAEHAMSVEGDFIECGTDRGGFATAILNYTSLRESSKTFWLVDTYDGLVEEQITEKERDLRVASSDRYINCWEEVQKRFAEENNISLVRGAVPDSLSNVHAKQFSYCSIDMNCAEPEAAALEFVWPKLTPGGVIIFDDYGFPRHQVQRDALDRVATKLGCSILSLPTGQGLLVK